MKFDTLVNLALAAIVFKVVYDIRIGADEAGDSVVDFLKNDINPVSENNYVYRGVSWIGGSLSGDEDWTLGTAVYDWVQ